jgi:hypothetical protein
LSIEKFTKKYYDSQKAVRQMEVRFSDYKTITETAEEWGICRRMVIRYCEQKRIPGAIKGGNLWLIPKDAVKPADGRVNNRRQPKTRNKI